VENLHLPAFVVNLAPSFLENPKKWVVPFFFQSLSPPGLGKFFLYQIRANNKWAEKSSLNLVKKRPAFRKSAVF